MNDYTVRIFMTEDDFMSNQFITTSVPALNRVGAELSAQEMYPDAYFLEALKN